MRKSWLRKFQDPSAPRLVKLDRDYAGRPAGSLMLVATPTLVAEYVDRIPYGAVRTLAQLREDLADAHGAALTCPMSTSIFVRIAAEAALERAAGETPTRPFWRLIDAQSPLARKLSCGPDYIMAMRALERSSENPTGP